MRKRHANKERCPCGSGDRVGWCHHRQLNRLRKRLGRYWFRMVEQQLLNEALAGKLSGSGPDDALVARRRRIWRPFGTVRGTQVRRGGISQSPWMRPMWSRIARSPKSGMAAAAGR